MTQVAALYDRLRAPTGGIAPSRARFRQFYDTWLTERRPEGGPENFIHAVVLGADACAECDPAPRPGDSGEAMRLALAALGDPLEIVACFSAALAAGLVTGADAGAAEEARVGIGRAMGAALDAPVDVSRAILHRASRHALTSDNEVWTDPGHLLPAILKARRRLCRIVSIDDAGKPVSGTGFLIGPGTVLTNWHVVSHVPHPLPRKGRLWVQFDFSETTGLEDADSSVFDVSENWLIARGEDAPLEPPDAADYWWDDFNLRKDWLDSVADRLDFAVLRLDGVPGLQRGWYTLPKRRALPGAVWAVHHPSENGQTLTRGTEQLQAGARRPHRFFHDASTVQGSSGGLLLDETGEVAGLHYMGLKATRPPANPGERTKAVNVAITLTAIHRQLDRAGKLADIAEAGVLRPFRGCLDGRHPVFGRKGFLDDLKTLFDGEKQIMRIEVDPDATALRRPGKSFSVDILRALFRGPEHHHILFRASDMAVDAYSMAANTLGSFAEDLVPTLPAAPETTTPAYVRQLVGAVAQAIRERLSDQIVWIVLDDLDRSDLSNASGREFLATIYNQIQQMPDVRVVLIGLPRAVSISGLPPETVIHSVIGGEDFADLKGRFVEWLMERGARNTEKPLSDESLQFLGGILASHAGDDVPLETLSRFVSDHVSGVADAYFGGAVAEDGP